MKEINNSRYDNMQFKLLGKIENFVAFTDLHLLEGCPRTYRALCDDLRNGFFNLINNCALANLNEGRVRIKYQREMLATLTVIDFYFGLFLDRGIIKEKFFYTLCNMLNEVRNMTYGWIDDK